MPGSLFKLLFPEVAKELQTMATTFKDIQDRLTLAEGALTKIQGDYTAMKAEIIQALAEIANLKAQLPDPTILDALVTRLDNINMTLGGLDTQWPDASIPPAA